MSTPKSQSDSPFRRLVRSLSRSSPRSERPPRPQGPDSPPAVPTSNKRYDDIARYAPGAGSPRRESPPSNAALSTSPPPGEPPPLFASEPSWRWGDTDFARVQGGSGAVEGSGSCLQQHKRHVLATCDRVQCPRTSERKEGSNNGRGEIRPRRQLTRENDRLQTATSRPLPRQSCATTRQADAVATQTRSVPGEARGFLRRLRDERSYLLLSMS